MHKRTFPVEREVRDAGKSGIPESILEELKQCVIQKMVVVSVNRRMKKGCSSPQSGRAALG